MADRRFSCFREDVGHVCQFGRADDLVAEFFFVLRREVAACRCALLMGPDWSGRRQQLLPLAIRLKTMDGI